MMMLHELLELSAQRDPHRLAVIDAERGGRIVYGDLNAMSESVRRALQEAGVRQGDRVGIYAPKSIPTLASVFGALKAGAAYVPVDPDAPASRNAFIFTDCAVRAVIVEKSRVEALIEEADGMRLEGARVLEPLKPFGVELVLLENRAESEPSGYNLAYILYTSGSTGRPKGVMHTHGSAMSFVDWCTETFRPEMEDRFSSHAPFHFDLSILDIYVPVKHAATLVLIGEELGKDPKALAAAISEQRITMWYSTPSILRLLVDYGGMERYDHSALRVVNFAGEVFPVKHLRALKEHWPAPRYFNLYGPTETNVCTWYEVPSDIPADRVEPYPIGKVCSNDRVKVVDEKGEPVASCQEGELYVTGGSVMTGYWNLPERTERAFAVDQDGVRWYRTGDVVQEDGAGDFLFLGRRDRMVKRRGYRVELGEIEAALYRHPDVREVAVVAIPHEESGVLIKAFLNWAGNGRASTIKLKQFAAQHLPLYMVPDRFSIVPALPKTSTDKIDYQSLILEGG